jgi:hypothetical protein
MEIKGFSLINEEKVERALKGTVNSLNERIGGVIAEDGTYDEGELLAEYDKLGGLITRGGDKVKTGSFYDFRNKKALKEPKVVFIYNINGKIVEVEDGKELPGIVKAARMLEQDEEEVEEVEEKVEKKRKSKK